MTVAVTLLITLVLRVRAPIRPNYERLSLRLTIIFKRRSQHIITAITLCRRLRHSKLGEFPHLQTIGIDRVGIQIPHRALRAAQGQLVALYWPDPLQCQIATPYRRKRDHKPLRRVLQGNRQSWSVFRPLQSFLYTLPQKHLPYSVISALMLNNLTDCKQASIPAVRADR